MITNAPSDFIDEVAIIDPSGEGEAICQLAAVQKVKNWDTFQQYLKGAPQDPLPYDAVSRNCLHKARYVMSGMCNQWAKDHPGEPPAAWGIITGDVPSDGDNRIPAWHALIWCNCEDGKKYLGGAQDREVMNSDRVSDIKAVEFMIVGGG